MKKLLTFLVCLVLMIGSIGLTACGTNGTKQSTVSDTGTDKPIAQLSVQGVSAPKLGGAKLTAYSTRSGQTGISKRLSATVEPASAQNKLVDYEIYWLGEGDHAEEPVTDYVVVEQDSDGSADATVTCIQAFGDDTIIIQVVTRDGGYTAQCVVTYAGFISEMSITSPTLNTVNTAARGDYYEVYTNNTYTFTVDMDNDLHDVKNYDLSVTAGGVGEFWFFNYVSINQMTGRWETVNDSNNVPTKKSLNEISSAFITVSISGNVITVQVKEKELYNYYIDMGGRIRYEVYDAAWIYHGMSNHAVENAANLPSAYFTVTVTDSVTNISETIKLWVESGVDGVSLSNQTLEF